MSAKTYLVDLDGDAVEDLVVWEAKNFKGAERTELEDLRIRLLFANIDGRWYWHYRDAEQACGC